MRDTGDNKRTLAITLVAMGAGAAGLYYLAGTNGTVSSAPQVFTSVSQCNAAKIHPSGVCEAQWNQAQKVHNIAAPAYENSEACQTAHGPGSCSALAQNEDPARAGKFIPVMAGYFFGTTPEGTFKGVPLYSTVKDGPNQYHVAEVAPKAAADPYDKPNEKKSESSGSGSRSLIFIPAIIPARASAPAAAAAAARPATAFTGSAGSPANATPGAAAPAAASPATAKPAAANTTTRGGLGASARSANASSGG